MADGPDNLRDEIKSSPSPASHGEESYEDANAKSDSNGEMGSSEQRNRETTVETIEPAGVEKSESDTSSYEQAEEPDDEKGVEIYEYKVERLDVRKAKIAVDNSADFAFKCNPEAPAGELALPEVLGTKRECVVAETVRGVEGALRKSPKRKVSRVKESPKRASALSDGSSDDEKAAGCLPHLSPQRWCNFFRSRNQKSKASPNRGAAFSPIEDRKNLQVTYHRPYSLERETVERIDYTSVEEEKIIPTFLGSRPCYDITPASGKIVFFYVDLPAKFALSGLRLDGIKSVPLYDAGIMDFVGMLTITDFINVLRHYHVHKKADMKDIENQSIATWRRMTRVQKELSKINDRDSLAQAAKLLIQERIHRIPVIDEAGQCVFVLSKRRLLEILNQDLIKKFDEMSVRAPSFFKKTIRELQIGTYENIAVVYKETKLTEALSFFVDRNVSSLPVLDKDNILISLFEKCEVYGLAKDQDYDHLDDMTVDDVISKPYPREGACICRMDETLETVIERFDLEKVHQLVVINARDGVVGMLSLSDVLKFLIVQPLESMESANVSDTILEGAVGGAEVEAVSPVEVDVTTGIAHMKVVESSETTDDTQEKEEPYAED